MAASRTDSPAPRAAPSTVAEPKVSKSAGLDEKDRLTILALAVSSMLVYGKGSTFSTLAKQCWDAEGALVFSAKLAGVCVAFAGCFAAVVHLWMKAAKCNALCVFSPAEDYRSKLKAVIPSLLIICGGYVIINYIEHGMELAIQDVLLLWVKSSIAALIWVVGAYACMSCVRMYRNTFCTKSLLTLIGLALFISYTGGIASYINQGWSADSAFFKFWLKFTVLAVLFAPGVAAVYKFELKVKDWSQLLSKKEQKDIITQELFAVGASTVLVGIASFLSATAQVPDGLVFILGLQLEAAAIIFACGCVLLVGIVQVVLLIQKIGRALYWCVVLAVVLLNAALPMFVHGFKLPPWLGSFEIANLL